MLALITDNLLDMRVILALKRLASIRWRASGLSKLPSWPLSSGRGRFLGGERQAGMLGRFLSFSALLLHLSVPSSATGWAAFSAFLTVRKIIVFNVS
jgi:hypothetical protein